MHDAVQPPLEQSAISQHPTVQHAAWVATLVIVGVLGCRLGVMNWCGAAVSTTTLSLPSVTVSRSRFARRGNTGSPFVILQAGRVGKGTD